MDFEIPRWLIDDRVRRRKQKREARVREFVRSVVRIVSAVMWVAALTTFIWFLFYLYGVVGELAKPISYIRPQVAEAAEASVREHEVVLATVTAYTSSVDETDDTPFITASGASTGHGVIACPPKYEFGTKVIIQDTEYVCEDRMNTRYHDEERFDIWVETKHEAFRWGVRDVSVKIIARI